MTRRDVQATYVDSMCKALFGGREEEKERGSCTIRYFDYSWGIGEFPIPWVSGGGSDPTTLYYHQSNWGKLWEHDPPTPPTNSYSREGKQIGIVVVPTVEQNLFLDKRKESLDGGPLKSG
jgi:hypothetical protein